jgi:hypothetical protein
LKPFINFPAKSSDAARESVIREELMDKREEEEMETRLRWKKERKRYAQIWEG